MGNKNKMEDTEDLECAPGSGSYTHIATPVRPARPEIQTDAQGGKAETRMQTTVRQTATKRSDTGVHAGEPDPKVPIVDDDDDVVVHER